MEKCKKILVLGLVFIETVFKIKGERVYVLPKVFPCYDVNHLIAGEGAYISKALSVLGNDVELMSYIGDDFIGRAISEYLKENKINYSYMIKTVKTPTILIKENDKKVLEIFKDFNGIYNYEVNVNLYSKAIKKCDIVILGCDFINKSLIEKAKDSNKVIALKISNSYCVDKFIEYADIVFISKSKDESSDELMNKIICKYNNKIVITNDLDKGCILYTRKNKRMERFPKVRTRKSLNELGIEESIFAAFINCYCDGQDPYKSMEKAMAFASYKVGAINNLDGFISEEELNKLHHFLYN